MDKSKKRKETNYIWIEKTKNGFNMKFISDTENGRDGYFRGAEYCKLRGKIFILEW